METGTVTAITRADYTSPLKPAWCPGCGDFGILNALKEALVQLQIPPYKVLMVSGIGQAGKLPHYTRGNVFNTLHGRTLPAAEAAKIVNSGLTVIAIGGDGDGYAEGGNHFLHAMRRNHSITYLVHDNQVYGLTKGQASPTSEAGFVTKSAPWGAPAPIHPLALAIITGATFVARGFSAEPQHLTNIMKQAITHKGFSLVDILQPCVSFNFQNTYLWYRERVYKLEEDKSYDPANFESALRKSMEWGDKIPIGLLYRTERQTYEESLPGLAGGPLVERKTEPVQIEKYLNEFARIEISPTG